MLEYLLDNRKMMANYSDDRAVFTQYRDAEVGTIDGLCLHFKLTHDAYLGEMSFIKFRDMTLEDQIHWAVRHPENFKLVIAKYHWQGKLHGSKWMLNNSLKHKNPRVRKVYHIEDDHGHLDYMTEEARFMLSLQHSGLRFFPPEVEKYFDI